MGAVNDFFCNVSVIFLGVPIAEEKTEKSKQCTVFAGIELDTVNMEARLPLDKIIKCRELAKYTIERKNIELRQLQSVIGLLNCSCLVVVPGRAFLRWIISLTIGIRRPYHEV